MLGLAPRSEVKFDNLLFIYIYLRIFAWTKCRMTRTR